MAFEDTLKSFATKGDAATSTDSGNEPTPGADEGKVNADAVPEQNDLTQEKVQEFLASNEELMYDFISKKSGKEIKSLEDLIEVREVQKDIELPEDVKTFMDFKKNTGRGFDDFVKLKKDWKAEPKEAVVMEYIRERDGLEGEMLHEYFELNFKPDEDDSTDKEIRLAKIQLEKNYKEALGYFENQKSQYNIPSEQKSYQRQAEETARQDAERFQKGISSAIEDFKAIEVEDFAFNIQEPEKIASRFSSIEKLMDSFKVNGVFDYKKLVSTIVAGENADRLAKAYADHYHNKHIESELAGLSNRTQGNQAPPVGGAMSPEEAVKTFKRHF